MRPKRGRAHGQHCLQLRRGHRGFAINQFREQFQGVGAFDLVGLRNGLFHHVGGGLKAGDICIVPGGPAVAQEYRPVDSFNKSHAKVTGQSRLPNQEFRAVSSIENLSVAAFRLGFISVTPIVHAVSPAASFFPPLRRASARRGDGIGRDSDRDGLPGLAMRPRKKGGQASGAA